MKRKDVRGLSPVVATVLLIVIVIAIALIVFIWMRGMLMEKCTKFDGKNVELVCDDISFDADYADGTLYISNSGNVPIFGIDIKVVGDGSYIVEHLSDKSTLWPKTGLNSGATFSDTISFSGNKIVLIPVLIGDCDSGVKTYTCKENLYGYDIIL